MLSEQEVNEIEGRWSADALDVHRLITEVRRLQGIEQANLEQAIGHIRKGTEMMRNICVKTALIHGQEGVADSIKSIPLFGDQE